MLDVMLIGFLVFIGLIPATMAAILLVHSITKR